MDLIEKLRKIGDAVPPDATVFGIPQRETMYLAADEIERLKTRMQWQSIETAPKDGRYLMVGNEDGVWVACYTPTFQSGFKPDNPWISLMLNHRHIEKVKRNYSGVPTHWMPLPPPPEK